jgi:hypothetical protein
MTNYQSQAELDELQEKGEQVPETTAWLSWPTVIAPETFRAKDAQVDIDI